MNMRRSSLIACLAVGLLAGCHVHRDTAVANAAVPAVGIELRVPRPGLLTAGQPAPSDWHAIAARGAAAIIPPRRNGKPWKPDSPGAVARNEALRASKRFGRSIWRRWSGYHRRSRAETKMHCVKLLGQRLMARDFDRQVAEFQVRVAVLNGYTALGIPVTKVVG